MESNLSKLIRGRQNEEPPEQATGRVSIRIVPFGESAENIGSS